MCEVILYLVFPAPDQLYFRQAVTDYRASATGITEKDLNSCTLLCSLAVHRSS